MKKQLLLLLLIPVAAAIAVPSGLLLHVDTYKVDTAASKVEWFAEKVTGKHNGTVQLTSGDISNDHGRLGGKFVMDMKTITVVDLTGENKTKLENHLRSEDFFSVEKFPTSTFEIATVTPKTGVADGEANFNVTGKLTIKGITNDVSFPAMIKFEGNKMMAKADITIDRSKYDIRYGSKSFFADIGDKAIMDDFKLKLDIVANK
ncbi:MAG: YceI family protein [Bacteroidota bacterium]|nr:YceI family protein [Bacteroidota bacterium]